MMKILILGADGQLGFDLMRVFGEKAIGLTHKDVEITDTVQVTAVIKKHRPDVVINTAAIVRAEWCEINTEKCFAVNAYGAQNVAKVATEAGAAIVFISTDYVFDGSKNGFEESDPVNAINVYGASKVRGEELTAVANKAHYIIRSSWFFGSNLPHKGLDFPRKILELARSQPEIRVVNDQFGSPTYTKDLAEKIKELIEKRAPFGIYHITNQGVASWYDFAKEILRFSGTDTKLKAISSTESRSGLKRPRNSILKNTKFQELGIALLREWPEALKEYLGELNNFQ